MPVQKSDLEYLQKATKSFPHHFIPLYSNKLLYSMYACFGNQFGTKPLPIFGGYLLQL